jgi:hypothetical protein
MIKCRKANVHTNGTVKVLLCELAIIVHSLKFDGLAPISDSETADRVIREAVETGLKTEAQLEAENSEVQP